MSCRPATAWAKLSAGNGLGEALGPHGKVGLGSTGAGVAPDGPEDELSAGNGRGEALGMVAAGGATGPEADGNRLLPAVGRPWWKRVSAAPFLDRVGKPGA